MINPRDLRLGNLVEHEVFGVVEVVAIYKHAIDVSKDGKTKEWFAGSIEKPIPLIEEWLLRFGAIVYEFDNGLPNQYRIGERLFVIRENQITDYGSSVVLKYVHQLQNLYFSLTQTELTLSNP